MGRMCLYIGLDDLNIIVELCLNFFYQLSDALYLTSI